MNTYIYPLYFLARSFTIELINTFKAWLTCLKIWYLGLLWGGILQVIWVTGDSKISENPKRYWIDHNDGQFFRAMEWLMFFSRPPLTSMVFQWFWQCWTITIECFLRAQPLVSMVFRWFSKFWGQWSTMVLRLTIVWMSNCKKCVKSIYEQTQILSRTCNWTSIESYDMDHIYWLLTSLDSVKFTQYNRENVSNVINAM